MQEICQFNRFQAVHGKEDQIPVYFCDLSRSENSPFVAECVTVLQCVEHLMATNYDDQNDGIYPENNDGLPNVRSNTHRPTQARSRTGEVNILEKYIRLGEYQNVSDTKRDIQTVRALPTSSLKTSSGTQPGPSTAKDITIPSKLQIGERSSEEFNRAGGFPLNLFGLKDVCGCDYCMQPGPSTAPDIIIPSESQIDEELCKIWTFNENSVNDTTGRKKKSASNVNLSNIFTRPPSCTASDVNLPYAPQADEQLFERFNRAGGYPLNLFGLKNVYACDCMQPGPSTAPDIIIPFELHNDEEFSKVSTFRDNSVSVTAGTERKRASPTVNSGNIFTLPEPSTGPDVILPFAPQADEQLFENYLSDCLKYLYSTNYNYGLSVNSCAENADSSPNGSNTPTLIFPQPDPELFENYLSDCLRYLYTPEDNRECVNTIMENRSASPNVSLSTIGSTRPGPNFTSQADEQFSENDFSTYSQYLKYLFGSQGDGETLNSYWDTTISTNISIRPGPSTTADMVIPQPEGDHSFYIFNDSDDVFQKNFMENNCPSTSTNLCTSGYAQPDSTTARDEMVPSQPQPHEWTLEEYAKVLLSLKDEVCPQPNPELSPQPGPSTIPNISPPKPKKGKKKSMGKKCMATKKVIMGDVMVSVRRLKNRKHKRTRSTEKNKNRGRNKGKNKQFSSTARRTNATAETDKTENEGEMSSSSKKRKFEKIKSDENQLKRKRRYTI